MKQVQLLGVFTADFRKSARTIYDELKRKRSLWKGEPTEGKAYVFVSTVGNQLLFITGDNEVINHKGTHYEATHKLLDYRCWRLENSTFNGLLLENYARAIGLSFGLKMFEDWYAERRAQKSAN